MATSTDHYNSREGGDPRDEERMKDLKQSEKPVKEEKPAGGGKAQSPVEGLTTAQVEGLQRLGYSIDELRKMSLDTAKAAYWNKIERSIEHEDGLADELHSVLEGKDDPGPKRKK